MHANSELCGVQLDMENYGKYRNTVEWYRMSVPFYVKF
jgi:hypothetical protein